MIKNKAKIKGFLMRCTKMLLFVLLFMLATNMSVPAFWRGASTACLYILIFGREAIP